MKLSRFLTAPADAEERRMAEAGYDVQRSGLFTRTYRLSDAKRAELEAAARTEQIESMTARVHADLQSALAAASRSELCDQVEDKAADTAWT